MVLGNLFHLVGAYMLNAQLAEVLFLCMVLLVVQLHFHIIDLAFLGIFGCFLMPAFMDQCDNFVVNVLFYWEPV